MPANTINKDPKTAFKSARIALNDGWRGVVSQNFPTGEEISADQWICALKDVERILSSPQSHLKVDGNTSVAVYDLVIGPKTLTVAIKTHTFSINPLSVVRSFLRDKSLRNFKTAARLCRNSIPTVFPLAALTKKSGLLAVKTAFITEYIPSSSDLHSFLSENVSQIGPVDKASNQIKRQAADQIANIFAHMHSAGLWHRDAKAGNFLVAPDKTGSIEIMLVDMDGIKPYLLKNARRRYSQFAKLGSVLLWHHGINLTDYLRSFRIYCNLTEVDKQKSDQMFRRIARSAIGLRLLTLAVSAIKK